PYARAYPRAARAKPAPPLGGPVTGAEERPADQFGSPRLEHAQRERRPTVQIDHAVDDDLAGRRRHHWAPCGPPDTRDPLQGTAIDFHCPCERQAVIPPC